MKSLIKGANPFRLLILVLSHIGKFLRVFLLGIVEIALAGYDLVVGLFGGKTPAAELKFLPSRIGICIILRELVRFLVKNDLARGLPVIHANFLGYDEQSHRRGPSSAFAHWSLKGIDGTIRDLFCSAMRTGRRDYQVIVFSDHGQEAVQSYPKTFGRSIQTAVLDTANTVSAEMRQESDPAADAGPNPADAVKLERPTPNIQHPTSKFQESEPARSANLAPNWAKQASGIRLQTCQMSPLERRPTKRLSQESLRVVEGLHSRRAGHNFRLTREATRQPVKLERGDVAVTALGPLGHVYFGSCPSPAFLQRMAAALVEKAGVPLVLHRCGENKVKAFTPAGVFELPGDAPQVLGKEHPFPVRTGRDLVALCHSENAGDLVISGWTPEGMPLTFATENGAHGGPGDNETNGFIFVPPGLQGYMNPRVNRPGELREAILNVREKGPSYAPLQSIAGRKSIRVVTYNIHSCIGLHGRPEPEAIVRTLQRLQPDYVALQEVDCGKARSLWHDQADYIAEQLGMNRIFLPLVMIGDEQYGIATLGRTPFQTVQAEAFPSRPGSRLKEERGALLTTFTWQDRQIHFANSHFGLRGADRQTQLEHLLGPRWLGGISGEDAVILCGDLNSLPGSPVYRRLISRYLDVQKPDGRKPVPTFFSRHPFLRLDHIFVSNHLRAPHVEVLRDTPTTLASDHLPVCVDLAWRDNP